MMMLYKEWLPSKNSIIRLSDDLSYVCFHEIGMQQSYAMKQKGLWSNIALATLGIHWKRRIQMWSIYYTVYSIKTTFRALKWQIAFLLKYFLLHFAINRIGWCLWIPDLANALIETERRQQHVLPVLPTIVVSPGKKRKGDCNKF